MTFDEFLTYTNDVEDCWPEIGKWLKTNQRTARKWFDAVFSLLPLDLCLQANQQLLRDTDDWYRDRLPAKVQAIVDELRGPEMRRRAVERTLGVSVGGARQAMGASGRACQEALEAEMARRGFDFATKRWSGEPMTKHERRAFIDDWFAEHDKGEDCNESTFVCLTCQDTGQVSRRDSKGRHFVGACNDCEVGRDYHETYTKSGRKLGWFGSGRECVKVWDYDNG